MAEASAYQQSFLDYNEKSISGFQASPFKGGHVVVAIDIGTTYSGYAWSFSSTKHTINAMRATNPYRSEGSTRMTKVPTTLLLRPDQTFDSFGHEAMKKYNKELDEDEQKEWYYFERFKMHLHTDKNLTRQTSVRAANRRDLPIRTIFAHALRYFKTMATQECQDQSDTRLKESEFGWVITVPAIWKGGAKQTMREAAYEAGLASEAMPDRLEIALEPESASLYCKSLKRIGQASSSEGLVARAFTSGTKYVLADLGGGTADVTVHQVTEKGGVKELHHATGGAWGGTYVDKNFVQLLHSIFGKGVIEKYEVEYPGDWVELISMKFETNKRTSSPNNATYVEFPFSFHSFLTDRKTSVKEAIAATGNSNLKCARGALAMKYPEVCKLFQPVFVNIAEHLETIIRNVGRVEYMILVGGFATCELLQNYLRDRFEKSFSLRIIIPPESSLAVVMGAVLFGHDPTEIVSRRVRYTYSMEFRPGFVKGLDPVSYCIVDDTGKERCRYRLKIFVRRNDELEVGQEVMHVFCPPSANATKVDICIYSSEILLPRYSTDEGVKQVARMTLPMPNTEGGYERRLHVAMRFGKTEIEVVSTDVSSSTEVRGTVKLDFLGHSE